MKTFYEMMQILEDEGLGDKNPQTVQDTDVAPEMEKDDQPEIQNFNKSDEELQNYMFFSNLKMIKSKVEEILSMDPKEIDAMLSDGHDWASDHISTSRDDVEEVYNWLMGEKK